MKAKIAMIASIATVGIAGSAMAGSATGTINASWPATPGTGGGTGTLTLPATASIQSITVQLATTWCSDLDVFVDAPGGGLNEFELMDSEDGSSDLGLVAGSGALTNVADYNFVQSGGGVFSGSGLFLNPAGNYNADLWTTGGFAAGVYTLNVTDVVGGDGGAVGTWTINYTLVPAPGAFALLGLAGLVGARRRRA